MADRHNARSRLREAMRAALHGLDAETVSSLESEIRMIHGTARKDPRRAVVAEKAAAALRSAADLQTLASEVRAFSASKRHSETASLFDLAAVGILALENVLTAERLSLFRLLMSGLSEASMYAASRQYVAGSNEVLTGIYRVHRGSLYGDLWDLGLDLRGPAISDEDVQQVRAGIDVFLARLDAPELPVEAKVSVLYQARVLLLILRCLALLDVLET